MTKQETNEGNSPLITGLLTKHEPKPMYSEKEDIPETGYYRINRYCPGCKTLLCLETWNSQRMFAFGSVLKSNRVPKFCPECGQALDPNTLMIKI